MKKICAALAITLALATPAFSADLGEFTIDGEVKTGVLWEKNEKVGKDVETKISLNNKDDAGNGEGRVRLNLGYVNGNVGIKARINWENWNTDAPVWPYFFGYINSFNDQLTVSLGKLGASPWGTGGPEEWKELELGGRGGMRVEYKPDIAAVPWLKGLNAGFVLNWFNNAMDQGNTREATLADILRESVIGVSYDHPWFLVRFAYRLDSDWDSRNNGIAKQPGEIDGDDLIFRAEERYLQTLLPGMQIWALGVYEGVGVNVNYNFRYYRNWLFAQYAPELFTAQIRLGYIVSGITKDEDRSILSFKPSFYFNFFDNLLSVGASFLYENDFGKRIYDGAPYTKLEVEPQLRLNFNNGWIAFVYNFRQEYIAKTPLADPPIERFQYINLRFGMVF